jgi:Peptidase A4 family
MNRRQLLHLRSNTNSSSNWFEYNQGTLEQGGKLFNSITGDWTVPTATQHTAGQAEDSSDWIGIGRGCIDAGYTATDSTLIQTGTEQDATRPPPRRTRRGASSCPRRRLRSAT